MFGEAEFSVALGVVDLFPTLIYLAFIIYAGYFLFKKINIYLWIIFIMGGALSVISGITLAIFKILVGLNGETFKLPVYLFCLLSIGVAVSSVPLFISTFKKSKSTYLFSFAPVLATGGELIFNRLAIVFTVIGMGLGLAAFVRIALKNKVKLPYVFIALDIVMICLMGTTGMMERIFSSATAHWIAEAINILNQTFFLISGILAFESCKKKSQKLNDKV